MKTLFVTIALLAASAAHASQDSTRFSCEAGKQPNGLGIERLTLDLSTEDPDGEMTVTYENADKTLVGNVDYEGDYTRYEITPSSKALGDISVILQVSRKGYQATVKSDSIDTFSVLECEQL